MSDDAKGKNSISKVGSYYSICLIRAMGKQLGRVLQYDS